MEKQQETQHICTQIVTNSRNEYIYIRVINHVSVMLLADAL